MTGQFRTIDQIRDTIMAMPFARRMRLSIDEVGDGCGAVSAPLSDTVTYDGQAFAAMAVGAVADVAAGAATLAMTPLDQMAYTAGIDSKITASTRGSGLVARAELRERTGPRLIFDVLIEVVDSDDCMRRCGEAVITMHITEPVGAR